jgi:Spy/CpxP family protein refolding chaperone
MNWKMNKKWILATALVTIMVAATAAMAMHGFKGYMRSAHGKGFVKERVLSRVDYTMQELKLTPEQHAKYAIIRTKMAKELDAASERHDSVRKALHSELNKPTPDMNKLATTMKSKVRTMPETVTMQIDYLLEVYEILTPAQQTELVQMLKQRMDCMDRFGPDGEHPAPGDRRRS